MSEQEKDQVIQGSTPTDKEISQGIFDVKRVEYPNTASKDAQNDVSRFDYLTGWRLHLLTFAICLSLFLASLEVSIVSTALVSIADDLQNFSEISWIIAAYLLTYTGFLVIWAKLSDLMGRKSCLTTAIAIFIIFSGACGAAQTSKQLIAFRALQGLGGSGMTSVTLAIITEMIPPSKYPLYSSITAMSFAFSYLVGPLLGAAINDNTTWRWVFLINAPAGVVNAVLLQIGMPNKFPHHIHPPNKPGWYSLRTFRRLDLTGCFLLFGASALLVACLEEAGLKYRWSSALVIVLLALCGLAWVGFSSWEWYVTRRQERIFGREVCQRIFHGESMKIEEDEELRTISEVAEPVFPWRFVRNRVFLSMLLCAFSAGVPFTVSIISIPQRLQTVNSLSAFDAGVRLLPFAVALPVGSIIQSTAAKKGAPCVILLLVGSLMQVAGAAAQLKLPRDIKAEMYVEQIIAGIGVGINLGILILWTPFQAKGADTSVGMSSITQIRALGGVVGIAIVTNIFNTHIRHALEDSPLSAQAVELLLKSPYAISNLPQTAQETVRETFAEGYRRQVRVVVAFSILQVLTIVGMVERTLQKVI